jgi:predicted AlkP superfamily phosphohydrolase/phosphomutase/tetratricopeptide (TPR) repeat protein
MHTIRSADPPTKRVLLVGWDGADWKIASPLMDAGELPQLANLVAHGASGPLASLPPYLSPMLWNSIATGKYADQHGILGFTTTDPVTGRLAAITSTQRKCKALWNILSEHGLKAHVLGWFASHPAENVTGVCVTEAFPRPVAKGADWPLAPGSIHPPELADEFAELRLRPEDVNPDILRLFIPRMAEIDSMKDRRPEQLAIRLAELYSVHNAAIAALDRGPCDFLAVYYHFIDWVCHDFMDFHPPRRPQVPEREFEWYRDVVNSAYRLQDLLLRDLLAHSGPDSTVVLCSDHGFHSDARRPVRIPMVSAGIAIWHRAQGIFAAAGPCIARDALVPGATVLDMTPTVLHLLGLPAAADMDGHVLASALASPVAPKKIPSYENISGPNPRPRHLAALSQDDQRALLDQFAALGYVDLTTRGPESPAVANDRDNRWNLAITLRHAGKHEAALAVLEQLHLERPEDARYAFHLAMCQLHLGLTDEAAATAETIADFSPGNTQADALLAEIALCRGDTDTALAHLAAADASASEANASAAPPVKPTSSNPSSQISKSASSSWPPESDPSKLNLLLHGQTLLRQNKILEACAALRAAVEADNENPSAWLAYAQALLQAGHPADAEICAREAVALAPTLAMAQFTLGQSLATQQKNPSARAAFTHARALNPRLVAATRALDRLEGKPFVATVPDFAEKLEETPPVNALRSASAERRAAYAAALAQLRATAKPLTQFTPSLSASPATNPQSAIPNPQSPATSAPPLVLVSGLPRSGTSLMMQMLARGGLPPMTDGHRAADSHNPEGYFEWDEIKNLPRDPTLIARSAGHAVKVVSPLLPHLPALHHYKIIFMLRPPAEVARSQHKMRSQLVASGPAPDVFAMQPRLAQHAEAMLAALRAAPNVELLTVDYPALIADPAASCARVAAFLGAELLPTISAMPSAVRPELHREKESAV